MILKFNYFGMITEVTGITEEEFECNVINVADLKELLLERYPPLKTIVYKIAVNHQLIDLNYLLNENDLVALLPPFAGG
jgi:sulfur-carrier protein